MNFEYEITIDEYVSAHLLREKLSGRRARIARAACFMVLGLLSIIAAWNGRNFKWMAISLLATSAFWIYAVFVTLHPASHFRRVYRRSGVIGKRFTADVNEDGFDVEGDLRPWHVEWPGAYPKGENESVFAFYSAGTVFVFGKKYLNGEQQLELRRLGNWEILTPSGAADAIRSFFITVLCRNSILSKLPGLHRPTDVVDVIALTMGF